MAVPRVMGEARKGHPGALIHHVTYKLDLKPSLIRYRGGYVRFQPHYIYPETRV